MERNFLKRKVFRLNRPVAAKTGFPPFASRSLPFRQLRGSNPGCKPGRARKRTRKKDGFCASKSRSMRSMQASGLQARPCAEAHTKKRRVLRTQFTVLNTKNLCSAGSGILQQSAVQFLLRAQAKYLQFSDRSKVFYHLCALQEFFPIPP